MLIVSFTLLHLYHGLDEDDVSLFLHMYILLAFHTLGHVQWMIEHSEFYYQVAFGTNVYYLNGLWTFNYSFMWMWYLLDLVLIKFKCDSMSWDP